MISHVGILLFFILSSCSTTNSLFVQPKGGKQRVSLLAKGQNGVVSSAHPLASKAGLLMLKKGGNAADAAIASSFAISVLRPQSTGIGGGGFLLYYDKNKQNIKTYDFRERAPIRAHRDMYLNSKGEIKKYRYKGRVLGDTSRIGYLSVGVPGVVAGLLKFHRDHGSLSLEEIIKPAITLAEEGFRVYLALEKALALKKERLLAFDSTKKIFFPNDKSLKENDLLIQEDLAKTLKLISKNKKSGFYKGDVAKKIIDEMKRGGGLLRQDDLDLYKTKEGTPVVGYYRGYKIASMGLPSSGGIHIIQMLNILSNLKDSTFKNHSVKHTHYLVESMRSAFYDRAHYLGDPDFSTVPVSGLLSRNYAKKLYEEINPNKSSVSKNLKQADPNKYESLNTTHISVVDKWGNSVSTTQTINHYFGSGVIAEGTGFFLNNEMDDFTTKPGSKNSFGLIGFERNAVAPRKTMLSSMAPTMVFDSRGQLKLVLGSPGGPRIITAVLQTIINIIDFKMKLIDAVHAKRIHHQWLPDKVYVETGALKPSIINKLEQMGHKIEDSSSYDAVEAIEYIGSGWWSGVSDSRSDGVPSAF